MSHRGSYHKGSSGGFSGNYRRSQENYCSSCKGVGDFVPMSGDYNQLGPTRDYMKKDVKESFGMYSNNKGCNYSLGGEYSIMGNSACSCGNLYGGQSCPCGGQCSCSKSKKDVVEGYCRNCGNGYRVFNYDMIEGFQAPKSDAALIPALPPYYFTGNSKLTIEDPDNAFRLFVGAYTRKTQAEKQALELQSLGLISQAVAR